MFFQPDPTVRQLAEYLILVEDNSEGDGRDYIRIEIVKALIEKTNMPNFLDTLLTVLDADSIDEIIRPEALGRVVIEDDVRTKLSDMAHQRESEIIAQHVMYPDYY